MICVWISFLGLSDWDRFSEPQGRSKWLLELASEPQWRSKWPLEEWWFPFVTGFSDCWLTPPLPHQPLPPAASASSTAEFLCAPPPSSPTITNKGGIRPIPSHFAHSTSKLLCVFACPYFGFPAEAQLHSKLNPHDPVNKQKSGRNDTLDTQVMIASMTEWPCLEDGR